MGATVERWAPDRPSGAFLLCAGWFKILGLEKVRVVGGLTLVPLGPKVEPLGPPPLRRASHWAVLRRPSQPRG